MYNAIKSEVSKLSSSCEFSRAIGRKKRSVSEKEQFLSLLSSLREERELERSSRAVSSVILLPIAKTLIRDVLGKNIYM